MNDVIKRIKAPATGLLIVGILNGLTALLMLLSGLIRLLSGGRGGYGVPTDDAERLGYYAGTVVGYVVGFLCLLVTPVVIYGAIQMMNARKYGLAMASAVLAIIPLTSCCFVLGIPIGIWALVVLRKPEIKAAFRGEPIT
jgi:hypothetical protein